MVSYWKGKTGENSPHWNGGVKMSDGYHKVFQPDHPQADGGGYVFEHRLIMEKKLGRYLTHEELVHHKNRIKTDNRPENLELMSRQKHLSIHFQERVANGFTNKKDMSGRTCYRCGATNTLVEGKYPHWRTIEGRLVCHKCYMKAYHNKRREESPQEAPLTQKIII